MIAGGRETDEQQVQDEPAGTAITVQEGVDPLEAGVESRKPLGDLVCGPPRPRETVKTSSGTC
jgi:hypothetical protein